jgi:2-iminoacetate synthase ThiH
MLCRIMCHYCDFKVNKVMDTIKEQKKTKKSLSTLHKS